MHSFSHGQAMFADSLPVLVHVHCLSMCGETAPAQRKAGGSAIGAMTVGENCWFFQQSKTNLHHAFNLQR